MPSQSFANTQEDNLYLPQEAEIVRFVQESKTIFTLHLRLTDPVAHATYTYHPGQFNMLYLYGVGEVAISIVSDPEHEDLLIHTINRVGRVTKGFAALKQGQRIGIRGPFGRGWPLREAEGQDLIIVSGGLGCAPVVSVINYILRRRERFGRLTIVQKVKHVDEFIWPDRYERWQKVPDTHVLVASTEGAPNWPWEVSPRIKVIEEVKVHTDRTMVMMCGPEGMMRSAAQHLIEKGVLARSVYLSMERNMQCAVGHCGHCQFGASFICKNGPVYSYPELEPLLGVRGF
ncbi:FAD/NAD(P)-binding protein [Thioflexithrix psekupsensis]|uniref:Ni/Fe hydrogenase subunit gamma n=1 Tax=Thioflexithrix psekupsensis TaxID=1570016 RepID=A0A251XC14_9GAMM|nr:FAD/NAD(P)-binding protein [Thioflexithrix psekupsensis]OUD15586.1 Ni/Fe hydrogenase subunit gamma [Thioflexithrix psekupsensis]